MIINRIHHKIIFNAFLYSHPKGLVLLKVISSGKLKTNTCLLSPLFFVVWESPSSHPCQKSNIIPTVDIQ